MEIFNEENISSQQNFMDFATTQGSGINLNGSMYKEATLTKEQFIAKIVILSTFPVLLVFGTVGNVLTFIVMQRGELKHSSTCFYLPMLAVADSCKYDYIHRGNVLTPYTYMSLIQLVWPYRYTYLLVSTWPCWL